MNVFLSALLLIGAVVTTPYPATAADPSSVADMHALLKAHPELVLDVLRSHPEEVLDIARSGAMKKRDKAQWDAWQKDLAKHKFLNTNGRTMRGDASAPVTIVAFSDFTCPYCKRANDEIQAILKARPKDVRYLFKYFPVDDTPAANMAAEWFVAATLRDGAKAWALYDALFDANERLVADSGSMVSDLAARTGLSAETLRKDAAGARVRDILDSDMAEATALDVQGTPVLFINDLILRGAPTAAQLNQAVDLALTHAKSSK